jgi:hypothetical protein
MRWRAFDAAETIEVRLLGRTVLNIGVLLFVGVVLLLKLSFGETVKEQFGGKKTSLVHSDYCLAAFAGILIHFLCHCATHATRGIVVPVGIFGAALTVFAGKVEMWFIFRAHG